VGQASTTAGHLEEPPVEIGVPPVVEAGFLHGEVEGHAVALPLAVHERPVHVEHDRGESAGATVVHDE
jgi:hypothetical protein